MKNLETIIRKLVDAKAEQDNQIDLNAYENGMRALAEQLPVEVVVWQSEQLFALLKYAMPTNYKDLALEKIVKRFIEDSK